MKVLELKQSDKVSTWLEKLREITVICLYLVNSAETMKITLKYFVSLYIAMK